MDGKRLEIVDFLKGFSIFTIVIMHLLQAHVGGIVGKALSFGGAGVHVFILCSGFGLYLSFLRKPLGYGQFLKRRFTKVYVPYAIVVLASFLVPFCGPQDNRTVALFSHLLLFKMFFEQYEQSFGGQMWFVSTIFQFYILWPLIVRAFKALQGRGRYAPLCVALCVSIAWATVVGALDKDGLRVWNSFFLQYLWEFVLGMSIADAYFKKQSLIKMPPYKALLPLCMVCMSLTGFMGMKGGILKLYNDLPSMLGYLSAALILYKLVFANRFFVFTNRFSYEWYLVHILVFGCVGYVLSSQSLACVLSVSLIASYCAAYLYSSALEKMNLR